MASIYTTVYQRYTTAKLEKTFVSRHGQTGGGRRVAHDALQVQEQCSQLKGRIQSALHPQRKYKYSSPCSLQTSLALGLQQHANVRAAAPYQDEKKKYVKLVKIPSYFQQWRSCVRSCRITDYEECICALKTAQTITFSKCV